jgi:hypothetical protein
MPPVIIVQVMSMGPGNSSSGRTYRRAATAANGTADNCAGDCASAGLCPSVSQRHRGRKTEQEQ